MLVPATAMVPRYRSLYGPWLRGCATSARPSASFTAGTPSEPWPVPLPGRPSSSTGWGSAARGGSREPERRRGPDHVRSRRRVGTARFRRRCRGGRGGRPDASRGGVPLAPRSSPSRSYWFRFLFLFVFGSSLTFAVMLAVVLLASASAAWGVLGWLRYQSDAEAHLPELAALAGLATVLTYSGFADVVARYGNRFLTDLPSIANVSVHLMLPTSLLSGAIFALLGKRLKAELGGASRPAAMLTLANTVGAMVGALLGGFVLLPFLGIERSVSALGLVYGLVSLGLWLGGRSRASSRRSIALPGLAVLGLAAALLFFPFGLMKNNFLRIAVSRWPEQGHVVEIREGLRDHPLPAQGPVGRAGPLPPPRERLLHVVVQRFQPTLHEPLRLPPRGAPSGNEERPPHQLRRGLDGEGAHRYGRAVADRRGRHLPRRARDGPPALRPSRETPSRRSARAGSRGGRPVLPPHDDRAIRPDHGGTPATQGRRGREPVFAGVLRPGP